MYVGYFYAVRGAMRQEERMDSISHNLANVNTAGFKQDRQSFEDFLISSDQIDFSPGPIKETDRNLDLAIQGEGFFKVLTADGEAYTRDGVFHTNANGDLLTSAGLPVLGRNGPVTIPQGPGQVVVDSQGAITKNGNQVDTLNIVDLADKTHLKPQGDSLFVWKKDDQPAQEVEPAYLDVAQGYLEQTNVNVVMEMANMIEAHRAFEAYVKSIQTFQDIDTKATNQVGRLK